MCDNWSNHFEQTGFYSIYPWESNDVDYREIDSDCKDERCLGRMRKCKNWDFCRRRHPGDLLSCWGGLCSPCRQTVGTLEFKNNEFECPICYDVHAHSVCYPSCNHEFCIECLRTMLFGSREQLLTIQNIIAEICNDCESCKHECGDSTECVECTYQCDHDHDAMTYELENEIIPFVRKCPFCRIDSGLDI